MDGTEPPCKKIGNAHSPFVIAIKKVTPTGNMTVGHPAKVISLVCSVFYSSRWNYAVYSEWGKTIFVQFASGGLEVLCILTFAASIKKKVKRLRN